MKIIGLNKGQSIKIGENIRIVNLGNKRGLGISIGIEAPRSIKVDRAEVWEKRREGEAEQKTAG